ncbi:MAG TPA: c-type cytochrome [Gemmatimonadaceae bacterium]|nr:c-type cytochrome [Gemmatimonadaceae bacterium]
MRYQVSLAGVVPLALFALGASCTSSPAVTASPATPAAAAPATASTDTLGPLRQRAVAAMLQRIAGRESAPAESVFQNVKVLKGVPAGRFLEIMNDGFGHGLGVSCGFCHVPGQWASDQKPNKNTARDMLRMVGNINGELHSMTALPDPQPTIGCITCHRMAQKPLLTQR